MIDHEIMDRVGSAERLHLSKADLAVLSADLAALGREGIEIVLGCPFLGPEGPAALASADITEVLTVATTGIPSSEYLRIRHAMRTVVACAQAAAAAGRPSGEWRDAAIKALRTLAGRHRDLGELWFREAADAVNDLAAGTPPRDIGELLDHVHPLMRLRGLRRSLLVPQSGLIQRLAALVCGSDIPAAGMARDALDVTPITSEELITLFDIVLRSGGCFELAWAAAHLCREGSDAAIDRMLDVLPTLTDPHRGALQNALRHNATCHPKLTGICRSAAESGDAVDIIFALNTVGGRRTLDEPFFAKVSADWRPNVRCATADAIGRVLGTEPSLLSVLKSLVTDWDENVRRSAARALACAGSKEAVDHLIRLAKDADKHVRSEAVKSIVSLKCLTDPERLDLLKSCRDDRECRALEDALLEVGMRAAPPAEVGRMISRMRRETHESQLKMLRALRWARRGDLDPSVFRAALRTADPSIMAGVIEAMRRSEDKSLVNATLLDVINKLRGAAAQHVVPVIAEELRRIVASNPTLAMSFKNEFVRAAAIKHVAQRGPCLAEAARVLADGLYDASRVVRCAVVLRIQDAPSDDFRAAVHSFALADPDPEVSSLALAAVLKAGALRRHAVDLRKTILRQGEALEDGEAAVASLAGLLPGRDAVVAIAAAQSSGSPKLIAGARRALNRCRQHSQEVLALSNAVGRQRAWGEEVGHRITGRPVEVHTVSHGLGHTVARTRRSDDKSIHLWVNAVAMIEEQDHGVDIFRGLVIHELGHHVWDLAQPGSRRCYAAARAEGLGGMFNFLMDERIERHMRSLDPEFGQYLDRLNAYAFSRMQVGIPLRIFAQAMELSIEAAVDALASESVPGQLAPNRYADLGLVLVPTSVFAHDPRLASPFSAFCACLRCGHSFDKVAFPEVHRAVELVPSNLRYSSHSELLHITRNVAHELDLLDMLRKQARKVSMERQRAMQKIFEMLCAQLVSAPGPGGGVAPAAQDAPATPALVVSVEADDMTATRRAPRLPFIRRPPGTLHFNESDEVRPVARLVCTDASSAYVDEATRQKLVAFALPYAGTLRQHLLRLGTSEVVEPRSRSGHRLDPTAARMAAAAPRCDILTNRRVVSRTDVYLGLLIDRSASMSGESIELARRFATLLVEATSGVVGVEGDIAAFDDENFIRLGTFRRHAIGSLRAAGGNDDAAALRHAAELAIKSRRSRRFVIMVSDGMPTECTFGTLRREVERVTNRLDVICAQVAVRPIKRIAFPHHIDVSDLSPGAAADAFGRLLLSLVVGQSR